LRRDIGVRAVRRAAHKIVAICGSESDVGEQIGSRLLTKGHDAPQRWSWSPRSTRRPDDSCFATLNKGNPLDPDWNRDTTIFSGAYATFEPARKRLQTRGLASLRCGVMCPVIAQGCTAD
jgi:hypothetical protein